VIKLDIVNAVVTAANITRTKAEQAVETVFESLKQALGRSQRIELRRPLQARQRASGHRRSQEVGISFLIKFNSFRESSHPWHPAGANVFNCAVLLVRTKSSALNSS
jgi:nucleoid DNA-binding protein